MSRKRKRPHNEAHCHSEAAKAKYAYEQVGLLPKVLDHLVLEYCDWLVTINCNVFKISVPGGVEGVVDIWFQDHNQLLLDVNVEIDLDIRQVWEFRLSSQKIKKHSNDDAHSGIRYCNFTSKTKGQVQVRLDWNPKVSTKCLPLQVVQDETSNTHKSKQSCFPLLHAGFSRCCMNHHSHPQEMGFIDTLCLHEGNLVVALIGHMGYDCNGSRVPCSVAFWTRMNDRYLFHPTPISVAEYATSQDMKYESFLSYLPLISCLLVLQFRGIEKGWSVVLHLLDLQSSEVVWRRKVHLIIDRMAWKLEAVCARSNKGKVECYVLYGTTSTTKPELCCW